LADDSGQIDVPGPEAITLPLDRAMAARLDGVVSEATAAFEGYDYARAIERTEAFFWSFCDDYLELVKTRAYGDPTQPGPASARAALALALSVQLRLFAPFVPFVTEEVWSWWRSGSVHQATWPDPSELAGPASGADPLVLDVIAEVLGAVRRAKTTAKQSMRAPVAVLTVIDTPERIDALMQGVEDLKDAGGVAELVTVVGPETSIDVRLDVQD
jgi:valyl-tRNA synthetase